MNNTIFIVRDKVKKQLTKKISEANKLLNIEVITLSELKKKYFFDYDDEAVFYISQKYNVIPDIAKIYIENTYYIKECQNPKIVFLKSIYDDLLKRKLLKFTPLFKKYLENKKIVLFNLKNIDCFYHNIFTELKLHNEVIDYEDETTNIAKKLYIAENKEEEVAFVASSIVKLVQDGIDINNIKIANVTSEYEFLISRIFLEFNIPIEMPTFTNINGSRIFNTFKNNYNNEIQSTINEVKKIVKSDNDQKILEEICTIVNEFSWCDNYLDVKDIVLNRVSNIKLESPKYLNSIKVIDFPDTIIENNQYVFLINYTQGILPVSKMDEDFLSDEVKAEIGLSTSIDLNTKNILEIQKKIASTKNLVVTFSKYDMNKELYISNSYDESLFIKKNIEPNYLYSNKYNQIKLIEKLDEYKKYRTTSNDLFLLKNHYQNFPYCTYDNTYKGIKKERVIEYLKNRLSLSYTSVNTYYQCGFRYYLSYILKVSKFKDSFDSIVGNIYHKILSECFKDGYAFDENWELAISKYTFSNKETFFLNKLKDELKNIIDIIKSQYEYMDYQSFLYEKEIDIPIQTNPEVYFKGFIDKIILFQNDDEQYAVVIDYKTGNPDISIENISYGLDMQLPIYVYLLKQAFKDIQIGGFYLQKILNNYTDQNKKIDSLKLQGYTNSNLKILSKIDSSYENSQIIKGLKLGKNGFARYSKVLSSEKIDEITSTVENKIKESLTKILDANFDINPKQIGDVLVGCKYCEFKDICYRKNKDIIKYQKDTNDCTNGGDEDAEMDS